MVVLSQKVQPPALRGTALLGVADEVAWSSGRLGRHRYTLNALPRGSDTVDDMGGAEGRGRCSRKCSATVNRGSPSRRLAGGWTVGVGSVSMS